jgi:hypothetical protein
MQELLRHLRANGFKNFIVSGGGADFMRVWVERVYGIPQEQVVGSTARTIFELCGSGPMLTKALDNFFVMFAIGVNHSFEHLTTLWRQRQLLLRSLLAAIGLVPLVVVVLLWLFDLPPAAAAGLAVLAAAPGAPLTLAGSPRNGRRSESVRSVEVEGQLNKNWL